MQARPEFRTRWAISAGAMSFMLLGCGGDDSSTSTGGGTTATVTVPGAPTIGTVTAGSGNATVTFTAPTSNGGATITGYTATCTASGQASGTGTGASSPITVGSLTNGVTYSCSVTATNSVGTSAASAAATVTPAVALTSLPAEFAAFGNNVTVVFNESAQTVSLEAAGRPDHVSPYWNPNNSSGLYVAPGPETTAGAMSPGFIENYTNRYFLTVPVSPTRAASATATSLGAIGIAVTGAPIFNQSEGNGDVGTGVASGFDNYGAHTGPQVYHYHTELTPYSNNDSKLIAILSDGFFLYGRKCASTNTNPTDLDTSNGHTSATQYNATPHYHYHIPNRVFLTVNSKDHYILFDGAYQGTPARITN